jgi:hypothetical protein
VEPLANALPGVVQVASVAAEPQLPRANSAAAVLVASVAAEPQLPRATSAAAVLVADFGQPEPDASCSAGLP